MTANDVSDLLDGGLLHALNPWAVIGALAVFGLGALSFARILKEGRDADFIERAARLGYKKIESTEGKVEA